MKMLSSCDVTVAISQLRLSLRLPNDLGNSSFQRQDSEFREPCMGSPDRRYKRCTKKNSVALTRTRVGAEYPNQLDYNGLWHMMS
jgi:hypothetical protein